MAGLTIRGKMDSSPGFTAGFDYLRIVLSLGVVVWHSVSYAGNADLARYLWTGNFRFLGGVILPAFFALSGFLIAGSLFRTRLPQFVALRVIRLVPALAVEVFLSAFVLGAVFTTLPLGQYFTHPEFGRYLLNVLGIVHFTLPGVFETNPGGPWVNDQLWTIPFELECYLAIVILSLSRILKVRTLFLAIVIAASIGLTIWCVATDAIPISGKVPGRVLVICFLAAVALYLYREVIPYSNGLGIASVIALCVFVNFPNLSYLAAFPAAYAVIWLGMMSPPKIPFGDLSYGVYLFHLPVEQTIMKLMPSIDVWWKLTLISLPPIILCAWLSWTLVEQPILSRKWKIIEAAGAFFSKPRALLSRATGGPVRRADTD